MSLRGARVRWAVAFWAICATLIVLQRPINTLTAQAIPLQSEYTLVEQLTKYLLLLMLAASVFAYRAAKDRVSTHLSVGFLVFSLVLYFSENNFINEMAQPVFGAVLTPYLLFWLFKSRSMTWLLFIAGCALLVVAALGDVLRDQVVPLPPIAWLGPCAQWGAVHEERLEVMAVAGFAFSLSWVFFGTLAKIARGRPTGITGLLACLLLITLGNSLLHYQYAPNLGVQLVALALSALGCGGIYLVNTRLMEPDHRLLVFSERGFYVHLALVFVLLPAVYHHTRTSVNLLLWGPLMAWFGVLLFRDARSRR